MSERSRVGVLVSLSFVACFVALLAASCGNDNIGAGGEGTSGSTATPNGCATPQMGCPCTPGSTAACGKKVSGDSNFVYCYQGTRECGPTGVYGDCMDGTIVAKSISTSSLRPAAFGTPTGCNGGISGPLLVCTSGKSVGEFCNTAVDCGGGVKRCTGGSDSNQNCKDDSDCQVICGGFVGSCAGGANNNFGCTVAGDCPASTCNPGGGGGACATYSGLCDNGSNDGEVCNSNVDCPGGGTCKPGHGKCIGGKKNNKKCKSHKHCKGGGTCTAEDAGAPGNIDPCDPYCNVQSDTALGLDAGSPFNVNGEGGLTVIAADGGPAIPTSYQTTAAGDSTCGAATNVHTNPCNGSPLTSCQQDFRCDTATNSCIWNGGEGWFDGAAGGVDLTIGAGCTYSGSEVVPLCNRGSVAVPPNTILGVNVTPTAEDACTVPHATYDCAVDVGAAGLAPGRCTNVIGCPVNGSKNAVVNAMGRDIAEAAGRCANNASAVKFTGAPTCSVCTTCNTTLTGNIKDPRGVVSIPQVLVYVPATTPTALPVGPGCDTCTTLASGNPMTLATTDHLGNFTLNNVPSGAPFQLVILAGKWRRIVTVPAITACGTAALSTALGRLPRNKLEGDIPKMAVTMAAGDALQCLLRKIGVDDAEFTNNAGAGRVHLYADNGMTLAGATTRSSLWGNTATLNSYDFVVAPCDERGKTPGVAGPTATFTASTTSTAAERGNVRAFVNAGGRLFATHWTSHDFVALNWPPPTGPINHEYGTAPNNDRETLAPGGPLAYTIDTSTPIGAVFAQWAPPAGAGVAGPPPTISFNSWRHLSISVNPGATRLTYGDSRLAPVSHPQNAAVWGGNHVNMYSFETPWPGGSCGRVVVSQSHVAAGSGGFPTGCGAATTAMTPQEKAFEFLLFNATACIGPPPVPPPPPPPPTLPTGVTFSADFVANCAAGAGVAWQLFQWKAALPPGTSINFRAATAANVGLLPAFPPVPGLPTTVPIGTANDANARTDVQGWTNDTSGAIPDPVVNTPRPVSWHLANDPAPPQKSENALRVYMTFNTTPTTSPTLYEWRQLFSCVPNE